MNQYRAMSAGPLSELQHLSREIAEALNRPIPELLAEDSPALESEALDMENPLYLIGLIGGKDVGKSAMVNALAGQTITQVIGHGEGTQYATAYVHADQAEHASAILDETIPGQYQIVRHEIERLQNQVLLDLPDIDSHYEDHIHLTRRVLRHLLFPVWIASVEKYADAQPTRWLKRVASGNDVTNFVFCLNKIDQLANTYGADAIEELSTDYAERIARALDLSEKPEVWPICAIAPEQGRMPELKKVLMRQRARDELDQARTAAARQQARTLLNWIHEHRLEEKVANAAEMIRAGEELTERIVVRPLREQTLFSILDDPAYRLSLIDTRLQQRIKRWPIVNLLHWPLMSLTYLFRRRLSLGTQRALQSPAALVDEHMPEGEAAPAQRLELAAGRLKALYPQITPLFRQWQPWQPTDASRREMALRHRLRTVIESQYRYVKQPTRDNFLYRITRWVLTIGALIWFPFLQPLAEAWAETDTIAGLTTTLIQMLSLPALATGVGLMVIYFLSLWLILKWQTHQWIDRHFGQLAVGEKSRPILTLSGQIDQWSRRLVTPLRARHRRLLRLHRSAERLASSIQN